MDPLQAMINGMNQEHQRLRSSGSQMTLGRMIERLDELPPDTPIRLGKPMSYRGYYEDLAFRPLEYPRFAAEVWADGQASMGKVFEGYKGGAYVMGENTPVWVAAYGECGQKLIAINEDGSLELQDDA